MKTGERTASIDEPKEVVQAFLGRAATFKDVRTYDEYTRALEGGELATALASIIGEQGVYSELETNVKYLDMSHGEWDIVGSVRYMDTAPSYVYLSRAKRQNRVQRGLRRLFSVRRADNDFITLGLHNNELAESTVMAGETNKDFDDLYTPFFSKPDIIGFYSDMGSSPVYDSTGYGQAAKMRSEAASNLWGYLKVAERVVGHFMQLVEAT